MAHSNITAGDLADLEVGQVALLRDEREQILDDLARGMSPTVCLSGPGEPKRLVRLTSKADLTRRGMPWARL